MHETANHDAKRCPRHNTRRLTTKSVRLRYTLISSRMRSDIGGPDLCGSFTSYLFLVVSTTTRGCMRGTIFVRAYHMDSLISRNYSTLVVLVPRHRQDHQRYG